MSTDGEFTARISEIGAQIGGILRDDMEHQRRDNAAHLRTMLEQARSRVGGEFAEALLQVMLVTNRWTGQAITADGGIGVIPYSLAVDEIATAIETGLGVRQP